MKKKTIIFDFDGTLADTFDKIAEIVSNESQKTKYKLSKEQVKNYLKYKTIEEIIKEFNFSFLHVYYLIWKIRRKIKKEIKNLNVFPEIVNVIKNLKQNRLFLITTNSKKNVNKFLKRYNIAFEKSYFRSGLFGKSKIINKIVEKNKLDKDNVFYIGDEIRDIEAAKDSKIKSIAVSWGFNDIQLLKKYEPDFLVKKPKDILKILK